MRPPENGNRLRTATETSGYGEKDEQLQQCGRSARGNVFVDRVDVGRESAA
jgi:hypothetical protein